MGRTTAVHVHRTMTHDFPNIDMYRKSNYMHIFTNYFSNYFWTIFEHNMDVPTPVKGFLNHFYLNVVKGTFIVSRDRKGVLFKGHRIFYYTNRFAL